MPELKCDCLRVAEDVNSVSRFKQEPLSASAFGVAINSEDFTRNHGVLIKRVDRAQPMIAVRNDDFSII